MKSNRIAQRLKPRAWFRHAVIQGTILAGFASAGTLWTMDADAQDPQRPVATKAWKQSGIWRAIGIGPRKPAESDNPMIYEVHGQGLVRKASGEAVVAKLSEPAPSLPSLPEATPVSNALANGVVNAIATDETREPSLVKIPGLKVDAPKAIEPGLTPPTSSDLSTSRNVGAKVRLSMSTVSGTSDAIGAEGSAMTNSSNLRVTRSGDITAETPVKVNFNQERILALPALPSPNSPYAESGIEIPVRVEAVAETVQSIIETQMPNAEPPAIGVLPAPEVALEIPNDRPPMLESPESVEADEPATPTLAVPRIETLAPEIEAPALPIRLPTVEQVPTVEQSPSPSSAAMDTKTAGPVSAAPTIVPLPSIEATEEEIQAISSLARSTQPNTDGVLSQPGAPVLITTGPLVSTGSIDATERVLIESQDIRALQVNGTISRLHVVDSSVCQVVCNGNRLFIVADQTGETTIEVNMGKLHKPIYIQVVVQRPWARSSSASVSLEQMQAIVTRLAPSAEVTVQPTEEGSLVVNGFVENNQQAKKVLEAIRKMVLVPVIDRLEIR